MLNFLKKLFGKKIISKSEEKPKDYKNNETATLNLAALIEYKEIEAQKEVEPIKIIVIKKE